jgi:KDO2-lipid IV(A) lauroyltransferase
MVNSMTGLLDQIEALLLNAALSLLRALGPVRASDLAGWLGRTIGPWLPVTRVADINLRRAMPELNADRRKEIIRGVYDNLARTVAELPHLASFERTKSGFGWEIDGASDALIRRIAAQGGPGIYFTGHYGNWEMLGPLSLYYGTPVAVLYRAANNKPVDRIINDLRMQAMRGKSQLFPKGAVGARATIKHLSEGKFLGLLTDQKMNDGIAVEFFGRSAMTAPALAALALRYRCPVIPIRCIRIAPARLRILADPPLLLPDSGNRQADIFKLTLEMNQCLERWIREAPQNWFWLHRRWPKE